MSTYLAEIHRRSEKAPEIASYEPEARSRARREALERLARYARVPGAPLLILGERGTGKTRLVETHVAAMKSVPSEKVVTVPCGALEPSLAESALFGHTKGAFTGAEEERRGLIAEADGGILFLDEVQDLPKKVQRKLVRTFQDRRRRFRAVGADEESEVSADLVCASNRPLNTLRKRLDADLFDRLSHLIVEIPPLRECRDDLADDWQSVWGELRLAEDFPQTAPSPASLMKALLESPLPSNLRDLQRLASLVMAWWPGSTPKEAFDRALAEWPKADAAGEKSDQDPFGTGTRGERVKWFLSRLAKWAHREFGTWQAAGEALGCDERTLRQDSAACMNALEPRPPEESGGAAISDAFQGERSQTIREAREKTD